MKSTLCLIVAIGLYSMVTAQTKNLVVEGTANQIAVIQTTSTGNSYSGLDLLRASAFSGTDWRIVNEGGLFKLKSAIDNFTSSGIENLIISANGRVQLLEGSESTIGNDSGVLMLGQSSGPNLSLDQNELLARDGTQPADLYLQAGTPAGNTYLNFAAGDVGIGTLTPKVRLGVEDNGFQMRISNSQQLSNEWFIGASHNNWLIGGDKLAISPTMDSRDAIIVLNKSNNTISAEKNRITSVKDPEDELDAVNYRTLKSFGQPTMISESVTNNFAECASHCRNLVEAGFSDWHLPSVHELTPFIGTSTSSIAWTSDVQSDFAYYRELNPTTIHNNYSVYHIVLSLFSGRALLTGHNNVTNCHCVR